MKSNKTYLICALLLVLICCIGAVSATDNDDAVLTDNTIDEAGAEVDEVNEVSTSEMSDEQDTLSSSEDDVYIAYVDCNATGDGDGSPENPFATLKLACDDANTKHHVNVTINMKEGTYYMGGKLDFDADNLIIQGEGNVVIKNQYDFDGSKIQMTSQLYGESFGLISSSSNFTISNIHFESTRTHDPVDVDLGIYRPQFAGILIQSWFYPFYGNASSGVFNNCSFKGFNGKNTLMAQDFNSTFISCWFDVTRALFHGEFVPNTYYNFKYCVFSLSKIYPITTGSSNNRNVYMDSIWGGDNSVPKYQYDFYQSTETITVPVSRYAIFNVTQNYLGNDEYEIIGRLTWNGTDDQDGMENFQPMTVILESENGGEIPSTATLVNGTFKAIYKNSAPNHKITATLHNQDIDLEFTTVNVTAEPVSILYGDDQNITINFAPSVNANVTITVNNKTYTLPVSGASAVFTLPEILKEGNYVVDILLNDNNYYGEASTNFTVSKVSDYTFEMVPSSEVKVGENLTITITLPDDATGNVTVKVGNDTQILEADETIVASFGNLNATTYHITVSYDGDDKYTSNDLSDSVTVDKGDSEVIIDSEIIADYGKIAIPVTTVNAKGVSVKVFSKSGLQVLNITCESDVIALELDGGEYTLEVTTIVDDNYNPDTAYANLTVNKLDSKITITVIDGLNVTGVLKDSEGNAIANASVLCMVGDENVTATTNENGEFTVTVKNNIVLNMTFEGNSNFKETNTAITLKNIIPQPKATEIIADNPFTRTAVDYKAGERGYMFYFTLKDEDGNVVPYKKVKIGIDGKIYTVTTDKDGKAGQMINMANENSYTYALSFLGDDDYKASFAVSRLIVVKKAVTITPAKTTYSFKSAAKTKTITATLKSTNSYIPKGKQVTLTIAGKTFKATIGDKGQISLNIGSITAKGTYKVAIKFAGTVTYKEATSSTITVKIA